MNYIESKSDVKELAFKLMNLSEKTRERICFMIEGALLKQQAEENQKPPTFSKPR